MDQEEIKVTYQDLIRLASGTDEEGHAAGFATLAVDSLRGDELEPGPSINFGNAPLEIYASGGCAVVQADFQKDSQFQYRRVLHLVQDWLAGDRSSDEPDILSLIIIPAVLGGSLYLIYQDLVYYTAIPFEDQVNRLILCFNNTQTRIMEDENLNLTDVWQTVQAELESEERTVDEEYAEMLEEQRHMQEEEAKKDVQDSVGVDFSAGLTELRKGEE